MKHNLKIIIAFIILILLFFTYKFYRTYENYETNEKINYPYQNSKLPIETRVKDLLTRMTLEEKIGQMALIEKNSIEKNVGDIAFYGLGALMSGGGGNPNNNTAEGWLQMINRFQKSSLKSRLKIPLLYGVDANHGHGNIPEATIFPHFIGLAATNDKELVKEVAIATAEEIAATGINWIFGPNLDVTQDIRWGRVYETFGSDSELVASLGEAYIQGIQSKKIAAAAKHYIGNGSTIWNSSNNYIIDQGNSDISENILRQIHLKPFKQAINANVKSIMVGLNRWNNQKITSNKYLLTDILRGELGFSGFVVSDWYGVYEKEDDKYKALVRAVNAGVDMIMLPFDYKNFFKYMTRALKNNDISETRLNEAVGRILNVKFEIGIFDNIYNHTGDLSIVGSKEHRELARKAVSKSLILLKNNNVVPISKNASRILVSGSAANDLGKQSGGWTVEWQGIKGNDRIKGTTILNGIKNTLSSNTKLEYDINGNFSNDKMADIGIAIVGEDPYAEGKGDNENPTLSTEDINSINNLRKHCKKIVVIIISGRPLNIKQYSKDFDAIIAAWLPGSEGQGIADVLFGDHPFTGILPIEWRME